jgi:hypothetical protein
VLQVAGAPSSTYRARIEQALLNEALSISIKNLEVWTNKLAHLCKDKSVENEVAYYHQLQLDTSGLNYKIY